MTTVCWYSSLNIDSEGMDLGQDTAETGIVNDPKGVDKCIVLVTLNLEKT